MKWRKWNNILHRDIGYLAVGLTLVFAISGIAVNHVADWNPNYSISRKNIKINLSPAEDRESLVREVLRALNIHRPPNNSFRPDRQTLQIFLENQTVEINTVTGEGFVEQVTERPLLHDFNFLHLNHAKKWWTWFSDLYAVALIFLSISGLFVLKGKNGLAGRGKWLTGLGFLFPIFFLIIYKYL